MGKFRQMLAGGSVNYRRGIWRFYLNSFYGVDYFQGQNPHEKFYLAAGISGRYKKWYFAADYDYHNYDYPAVSRTKYFTPTTAQFQINYNFKPNFYIAVAFQNFTGGVRQDTETYSENYRSFLSRRMLDLNVRPWILIRYTFRKNDKQKIKLNNIVTSKEKGISL